jgi:hypothetical protein
MLNARFGAGREKDELRRFIVRNFPPDLGAAGRLVRPAVVLEWRARFVNTGTFVVRAIVSPRWSCLDRIGASIAPLPRAFFLVLSRVSRICGHPVDIPIIIPQTG